MHNVLDRAARVCIVDSDTSVQVMSPVVELAVSN